MSLTLLDRDAPIYVAGHRGLVGSAIARRLERAGHTNLLLPTSADLDLREQPDVRAWFAAHRPEFVFLAAGTVGGVYANYTRPAEFLYDNLLIASNVIDAAYRTGVQKLLYLGSSCIYPRQAKVPIKESELLTGALEHTNEGYAIAKIAGIELCKMYARQFGCNFVSAMPTNLYGPGDNFDLDSSHVLPALMRKFHDAKHEGHNEVEVWGTGSPMREFLHVDDLADACLHLMQCYDDTDEHINVGTGTDVSIRSLANTIRTIVNPDATIGWDTSKPDGTQRKLLDVSKLHATGWKHATNLHEGVAQTYRWFVDSLQANVTLRGMEGAITGAA